MRLWACLLLLPTLLRADLATHRCGVPRAELTRYGETGELRGDYLGISCDNGEKRYLNCDQNNNQWITFSSGTCPVPTCEIKKLPPQSDDVVINEPVRNQLNDTVTFKCAEGLLGGHISFRCQRKPGKKLKFHWKPLNRTAEGRKLKNLTCTEPDEPSCEYGDAPHRQIVSQKLTYGLYHIVDDDELTLGCEDGYKLNGESWIFCDMDGIWNPELPQCEEIQCEVCEVPERAHLIARLDRNDTLLPTGTNVTHKEKVVWACEEGYRLTDAPLVTCNGDWQENIPSCEAIRCPQIHRPEHGRHVRYGSWRVGSSIVAECNDGYTLHGTRRRFCTTAGSWNGTLQICDNGRSTCASPGRPIGGTKHGESYNKGDKVTFSCSTDHTMLGNAERVCLDNGEWTGEETRCIAANEHMTMEEASMRFDNGIARLSEKSIDTKLQKEKLKNLMGKDVLLGKNKMKDMNPNVRSTIKELSDKGGIDVYYVLDTSGSISKAEKKTSVDIIKMLVNLVGVSEEDSGTGFGFLAFDSEVWKERAVNNEKTTSQAIEFLDDFKEKMLNRTTRGTAPDTAFKRLRELINTRISRLKDSGGARNRSSAIILLSDGIKNEGGDPIRIRNRIVYQAGLYNHEVHVYCIGVGTTNRPLLKQLATKGSDYLIILRELSDLQHVVNTTYAGNTTFGQCGVQGYPTTYTEDESVMWAQANTWRWVGALYNYRFQSPPAKIEDQLKDSEFICGVSLISKGPDRRQSAWALTAAHCTNAKTASKLTVKFGSLSSSPIHNDGIVVRVKRIIMHTNFTMATLLHDVAVLELEEEMPFSYDIRPVCLHKPNDNYMKVGTVAKMTGWGYLKKNDTKIQATLKQLSVRIQTDESCTNSTSNTQSKFIRPHNFCAGGVEVAGTLIDACTMDSGSPLVKCHQQDDLKRVCTQVGIVSFGDGCGKENKYGVYTNITTYYDWINEAMHQP